jgi:hypothetical protein
MWMGRIMPEWRTTVSVREMAQDFSPTTLVEIANAAEHRAKLLKEFEPKPWRRTKEQNDAIDTFQQLAAYCRLVIKMGE